MHTLIILKHVYLTESTLKILKQNRIITLQDFIQEDAEKLSNITKLNLPQILEIRHEIFNKYSATLISGATLFVESLTRKKFIPTGIKSLDITLDNGIPVGVLTEICGLAGCGKSQLCMQLAINCVKDSSNTVLYIDTKGDFSAIRIQKVLDAHNISYKNMAVIMIKIRLVRVWNIEDLIKLLENLKNGDIKIENLSLIIIDSLPCLMFQHFGDDNKIGLTFLNRVVNKSRYLSKEFQIGFIFVNIQTRWIDQEISGPDVEPTTSTLKDFTYTEKRNRCLGKYWQTIPTLVIAIEKNYDHEFKNHDCAIIKVEATRIINPALVKTCILKINAQGVS